MGSLLSSDAVLTKRNSFDIKNLVVNHETEVLKVEAADVHTLIDQCRKNPGHANFIPVSRFQVTDLPKGYRDINLYEYIIATADLTVRLAVKKVSPNRPQFWPGTKKPYPFCDTTESVIRTGTGELTIHKYIEGTGQDAHGSNSNIVSGSKLETMYKTCPCKKCQSSEQPSNVWWEIYVHTATHVVFDEAEAAATTCRLFYDEKACPVVSFDRVSEVEANVERDKCMLKYETCDMALGEKLFKTEVRCGRLFKKVGNKFARKLGNKFMFIVSHPHGGPKQVSVGKWRTSIKVGQFNKTFDRTKITYTTCTCPGSSGALIHCVGLSGNHIHSGALETKLNCSGVGYHYRQ
ncbi:hypothetical protein BgiMline_015981 [Biomphalaria glabrata]|nr:hypothetical protein BgiMline_008787 [Biomphalaria glabrata]